MKSGWQNQKLISITKKITDGSHNPPEGIDKSIYLMLSSKNVFDDDFNYSDPRYLSLDQFQQEDKRTEIKPNDVLLTIVGTIGRSAMVSFDAPKITLQRSVAVIRPDDRIINPRFLMYSFISKNNQLNAKARGVAQKGIYLETLREFIIEFPSLLEQKRIVGFLDKTFEGIAAAKANAEKNLKQAKELFQSALSLAVIGEVTKEWREAQSTHKTNADSELKELIRRIKGMEMKATRSEVTMGHESITKALPKEWRLISIETLFKLIDYRGKNPPRSKNGRRLITAKNIKMGYLSDEPITFVSEETYRKWMVRGFPKPNDIFFVTEGHTMGFVALNTRNDDFALAQRTITMQPIVSFSTKFFFYFMMSFYFQELVKLNATGAAAVGMKASKFRSLPLPFPCITEQLAIVNKLNSILAETQQLETIYQQKLAALDELKKSLLRQAFTGQL